MRAPRASAAIALLFGAALGASCGARTGLDAPGGGGAGPLECIPGTKDLDRAVPAVLFAVDASGSMDADLGASNESRWKAMRGAFESVLPPVDQSMEIGLLVYPTDSGEKSCTMGQAAIAPGFGRVEAILDELAHRKPRGATPTADAIDVAASTILQHRAAASARSIVLATDGGPNCNFDLDPGTCECVAGPTCQDAALCLDDVRTVGVIEKYAKKGIPTYVIGIAAEDDTFVDVLNEMADAGGRARLGETQRFYPVTSAADFDVALTTIRDQVGACTYLTKSIPDAGGSIVILVDGVEVPFDPSGEDGWTWADQSNGELVFNGPACANVSAGTHQVQATVACASEATTSTSVTTTGSTSTSSGAP